MFHTEREMAAKQAAASMQDIAMRQSGQNYITECANQIQKQAPIDAALDRLAKAIGGARDEVNSIEGRLSTILQPSPQSGSALGGTQPAAPATCGMESRINDLMYQVTAMNQQMRELRAALCV